jgi:hypothetical protein
MSCGSSLPPKLDLERFTIHLVNQNYDQIKLTKY